MRPFWFTATDRHARRRCCGDGWRVAPSEGGVPKGQTARRCSDAAPPHASSVRVRRRRRPHTHAHAHREDKGKSNGGHAKTTGGDRAGDGRWAGGRERRASWSRVGRTSGGAVALHGKAAGRDMVPVRLDSCVRCVEDTIYNNV